MHEQSSHAASSREPAEPWGYPSRCPRCYHLLEGLAASGNCPECGAPFDAASRFAYARTGSQRHTLLRWFWPSLIAIGVIVLLLLCAVVLKILRVPFGLVVIPLGLLACATLGVVNFGNATAQAFEALRRKRLQQVTVTNFRPTLGLYMQALAYGASVFVLSSVVVLAVAIVVSVLAGSLLD